MEGYQIRPLVILVIVIPVMQFEVLPALDHLSVDGTQSCLLVQVLRTKYRGCPQGALSIIVLEVRLPAFFSGVSQRSPSTPGVFLPVSSVTRLTAKARAAKECTNR